MDFILRETPSQVFLEFIRGARAKLRPHIENDLLFDLYLVALLEHFIGFSGEALAAVDSMFRYEKFIPDAPWVTIDSSVEERRAFVEYRHSLVREIADTALFVSGVWGSTSSMLRASRNDYLRLGERAYRFLSLDDCVQDDCRDAYRMFKADIALPSEVLLEVGRKIQKSGPLLFH